jgi:hypothetical protein
VAIGGTTPLAGTFTDLRFNGTLSLAGSTGTAGYVLTSNGASAPTWQVNSNGVTITDDTTTNATRYITFSELTAGTETTLDVSSTKLQFNPSSGILTSTGFSGALNGTVGATTPTTGAFTTVNGLTISNSTGTLTVANGKTLTASNSITLAGTDSTTMTFPPTSSSIGYLNIPQSGSDKTTSYTLALGDIGEFVGVGSGGSITIPNSTFAAGDAVSIFNNTTGNITITCTITTAYIAGTDTDKATVTLATRGVCTVLFISGTVCVLTGNVS